MSLAQKFAQVSVSAKDRISPQDLEFCETHQKAYEMGIAATRKMAEIAKEAVSAQAELLTPLYPRGLQTYHTFFSESNLQEHYILHIIGKTHRDFIEKIVRYFERTYSLDLEMSDIQESVLPRTREDQSDVILHYEDILTQIFAKLGGRTFEDQAVTQLKDACSEAAWNRYSGEPCFVQKKDTVSFANGCYVDRIDKMFGNTTFHLTSGLKSVMKAVDLFAFGARKNMCTPLNTACGYEVKDTVLENFWESKDTFLSLRLFKSGRLDIKFASEEKARLFIEEFLQAPAGLTERVG